jgi:hypothetical protein
LSSSCIALGHFAAKAAYLSLIAPVQLKLAFASFGLLDEHYGSDISPLTWKNESEAERSFSSF